MSRWFRMHDCILDDPKVQRLPGDLFKTWVNLLCVASRNEGKIHIADLPFLLRMSDEQVNAHLDELAKAGLLDDDGGDDVTPHKWAERQYKSDVSTTRVKRFRERSTKHSQTVSETPPETDTESDTEQKEEASASSLAAAAEKNELEEIANALEDATGWVMPGVHLIRDLIAEGHSLTERIVPLANESAASRRRLNKGKPESWAYLATIVRDNYREPAQRSKAAKAAQDLVKVPQSSTAYAPAAKRYREERGKPPPVVDGCSWFEPRYLQPSEAAA